MLVSQRIAKLLVKKKVQKTYFLDANFILVTSMHVLKCVYTAFTENSKIAKATEEGI